MANKLWENNFHKPLSKVADDFNSSISVDGRMYAEDITCSVAHVEMLGKQGIILQNDSDTIKNALLDILDDINSGKLIIDKTAEDVHTFVESELVTRIGDTGKKLHTARSRNDQVAFDTRLYLVKEIGVITEKLISLIKTLCDKATDNIHTVMSGYTHLQQAQPVTFAHWLMAYASMFSRDIERLADCKKRTAISPLGSCALAGTSFAIDREYTSKRVDFSGACINSMDGVSDRDFVIELAADVALIMMHLSRLAEETVLFSSGEFGYITLSDSFSTGSSIMPQKKNPDIAELVRGKTGRTYGNLMALLTIMKGLPLAYNKDMQEDKEAVFDSVDTVCACLDVYTEMLQNITVNKDKMLKNADKGMICATEVADYLTKKGTPFRTAYKIAAEIVGECTEHGYSLSTLPLRMYRGKSQLFDCDIYDAVDIEKAAEKKTSYGGASSNAVKKSINDTLIFINNIK